LAPEMGGIIRGRAKHEANGATKREAKCKAQPSCEAR
jgi:hypothetical protein